MLTPAPFFGFWVSSILTECAAIPQRRDDLRGLGIRPNKQNPFRCYLNTACDYQ